MNIDNYFSHIIIRVICGSRAYGMSTPTSDTDIKGIFIPPKEFSIGMFNIEQHSGKFEPKMGDDGFFIVEPPHNAHVQGLTQEQMSNGVEYGYYALGKYFELLSKMNPNIAELLWAYPSDYLWDGILPENRKLGVHLIANRDVFLSKCCAHTYGGYAFAQLKRIQGHNRHLNNPMDEVPPKPADFMKLYNMTSQDTILKIIGEPEDPIVEDLTEWGAKPIPGTDQKAFWVYLEGKGIVDESGALLSGYEHNYNPKSDIIGILVFQKQEYRQQHTQWKEYWDWVKNRNKIRAKMEADFGYDGKHASHLVRLMRTGYDLLKTGELYVRRDDAAELLEIRNGAWTYDQVVGYAEEMEAKIQELYDSTDSPLPKKPNIAKINDLYMELIDIKNRGVAAALPEIYS